MSEPAVPLRILVVDDHKLLRRGLVALLGADEGLAVVGEAGDAAEAQRKAAELQPDVILLDNHLPGVTGVQALPGLKEAAPGARIVLLTVSEEQADLQAALRGGAQGYLLKTIDDDLLASAIRRVARGEAVISPEMTGKLVTAFQQAAPHAPAAPDPLAMLSTREQQVLEGIALGESNKEIARRLSIAETTVKIHVQHILRKLNLASRVQAAVFAAGAKEPARS